MSGLRLAGTRKGRVQVRTATGGARQPAAQVSQRRYQGRESAPSGGGSLPPRTALDLAASPGPP